MDNETDAKVRSEQDRRTRTPRVIERFDMEKGVWIKLELADNDEMKNMTPDTKIAYLDIMTTISDIMVTGFNTKQGN